MAHSYRKDGPIVDSFTFNPNTLVMTLGERTYTFPASGSTLSGSGASVDLTSEVTGVLPGANGGTGVANTDKTITIGGNVVLSGAFATTLTVTAETALTLPTSGTLSTLAGTEALTNKTINGSSNTITNVSLTTGVTGILPGANGGTGVANTGITLTLAGNTAFIGAFTVDFNVTGNTVLNLPTSGTLTVAEEVYVGVGYNLPTADPTVAGRLWNDAGTVKVSAGV